MEKNPTRIVELLVGLGESEVLGVEDEPVGLSALHNGRGHGRSAGLPRRTGDLACRWITPGWEISLIGVERQQGSCTSVETAALAVVSARRTGATL